jgi:hypothetical protein
MLKSLIPARPLGRLLLAAVASAAIVSSSFAQIASDNASNAPYQPGNVWNDNSDGGTGFQPWQFSAGANSGRFIGGTALGNPTFGLFSSDGGATSSALRVFDSPLNSGQTFNVTVAHTSNVNTGGQLGVSLWNTGNSSASITFKFVGGATNWTLNDGGSDFGISQPYAANTPLSLSFTYNGGSSYSYSFGGASGSNFTASSTISSIDRVSFFVTNQGNDQNIGFNNLSVVPEPSTYALLGLGAAFGLWQFRRRKRD